MGFVDNIFEQTFSRHPYLFLFVIIIAGAGMGHSYNVFAQKSSVKADLILYEQKSAEKFLAVELRLDGLERTMMRSFSKMAVQNYNSEIHRLSELDRTGKATSSERKHLRELQQSLKIELDKQVVEEF